MLSKPELFARLAEGHAARITVVTPNRRLSQALVSDFDAFQAKNRKTVWEAADILPFSAFVERLYEDALYSDLTLEVPLLLTAAQEQMLWAEAIRSSRAGAGLLALQQSAEQCRKAWQLVHEWRIGAGQGNEDSQAFNDWSSSYRKKTASEVDAARLPDLVLKLMDKARTPKLLVAYAFDILPPQTREFFEVCSAQGIEVQHCSPERKTAKAARTSFSSSKEELEAAAQWARARLENRGQAPIGENRGQAPISDMRVVRGESGGNRCLTPIFPCLTPIFPRIGVVVPDLQKRRKEVVRVFSRVMQPGFNLPGAPKAPMPFNVSIGIPLDQYPVVALALAVLELSHGEISFERASNIIRSPFLGGAERERAARARLDVKLRKRLGATVSLPKLIANVEGAPLLRALLEKLFAARPREDLFADKAPSDWARHISGVLEAAGFPGERALDSEEYQARAKWNEALAELAKLDRVSSQLSFLQALSTLKRLCGETLFQAETAETPIQVLGVLESAGMEFDHLWVSGLTDERWPLAASPNPFIPISLQKKAGIPEASAESSLALDRRITEQWLAAAGEVVFSFYEKDEDRELAPSPLITAVPETKLDVPALPRFRDLVFSSKNILSLQDSVGPAVTAKQIRGGTRVLADQAACPFRAFARWRLAAERLEEPVDGLDAAKRGILLHKLMSSLWASLKDSTSLERDTAPAIDAAAAAAVQDLGLTGRFSELERTRLARLAREWLEVEKKRSPFEVISVEEKRPITFGGIEFSARMDRMDKLASGGHVLIDYKTSRAPTPKHWEPPRPDDPQLPLYAVSAREEIAAVAFAKLRPGDMKFMGFSKDEKLIEGVKKAKAWEPLLREWKAEAESLGAAFARGEARVDPKRELATCRYCSLQALCRVYEKVNVLSETEEGEE